MYYIEPGTRQLVNWDDKKLLSHTIFVVMLFQNPLKIHIQNNTVDYDSE